MVARGRAAACTALAKLDAVERLAFFGELQRSRTPELIEHGKDAVREGNAGKVEAVRLEFQNRTDRNEVLSLQFAGLLDRLQDSQASNTQAECKRTAGLA